MPLDTKSLRKLADEIYEARNDNDADAESAITRKYIRVIEEGSFPEEWVLPAARIPDLHGHNSRVFRAVISPKPWHKKLGRAIGSTMIYPIIDDAFDDFAAGGNTTWQDMDQSIVRSDASMNGSYARSVFIDVVVYAPRLLGEPLAGFEGANLLTDMLRHIVEFIPRMWFAPNGVLMSEMGDLPRCGCCTDDRGISEDLCKRTRFKRVKRDRTGMGRRVLDFEDYNKRRGSSKRKDQIRRLARRLYDLQQDRDESVTNHV